MIGGVVLAKALMVLLSVPQKHIKEHHEEVRERPCPHPGCNKVFMIDRYLQRHVKLIHTGTCPVPPHSHIYSPLGWLMGAGHPSKRPGAVPSGSCVWAVELTVKKSQRLSAGLLWWFYRYF